MKYNVLQFFLLFIIGSNTVIVKSSAGRDFDISIGNKTIECELTGMFVIIR